MKIKNGFVLRDVGGQAVVIAVGEASKTFHGMDNLKQQVRRYGKELNPDWMLTRWQRRWLKLMKLNLIKQEKTFRQW